MASARSATIVLVDDNESVLETTGQFLRSRGYRVLAVNSPFGVTALIQREQPAVVILDVMMPGLDGGALAKLLGPSAKRNSYTVILYSALPEEELYQMARSLPGCRYVSKTEGIEALASTVARCCDKP
jgi:DNA-binding response OmpR family regulator